MLKDYLAIPAIRLEPNVPTYVILRIIFYYFCKHNSGDYRAHTSTFLEL